LRYLDCIYSFSCLHWFWNW